MNLKQVCAFFSIGTLLMTPQVTSLSLESSTLTYRRKTQSLELILNKGCKQSFASSYVSVSKKPDKVTYIVAAFSNSNWTYDPDDHQSTIELCVFLAGNIIT